MHESWFSYSLTRRYPFKWFTPVVIIGGVLATVLFSVINLASNGYELRTIFVTNPNATIHDTRWFTKAPWSWGTTVKTTCEAQDIPVGSQVLTTVLGQPYTLSGVSQFDSVEDKTIQLTSLRYLNQTLEDCQMNRVDFSLRKADQSLSGQGGWWSWDNSFVTVTAQCAIATAEGWVNATLTADYNTGWFDSSMNSTFSASLWWGKEVSNLYWRGLLYAASQMPVTSSPEGTFWNKGQVFFTPDQISDIQDDTFFNLGYYFLASNGFLNSYNPATDPPPANIYNNRNTTQPFILFSEVVTESMFLAKLLYSLVLVDLGQSSSSNLLLSETNLRWILQHPQDVFRNNLTYQLGCENASCYSLYQDVNILAAPNAVGPGDQRKTPMKNAYDAFKDQLGPLGTKKTTLISQYQCSKPQRKPGGSLFVSILLADLVFLRACWYILIFTADWILKKRDDQAMVCRGCNENPTNAPYKVVNDSFDLNDLGNNHQDHAGSKGSTGSIASSTRSYQPLLNEPVNIVNRPVHP